MSIKITLDNYFGQELTVVPEVVLYDVEDFMGRDMTIPGIEFSEESENGLEPVAVITKSFGEFIAIKDCAYIDLNNCPYATKLLELGYAKDTGLTKHSGYCEYPLWQFDKKFLEEIGGEEYEEYSRQYDEYMKESYGDEQEETDVETMEQSM